MNFQSTWKWFLITILISGLLLQVPLLGENSHSQGGITGKITADPSGEVLPGCNIILRNLQGAFISGTTTDADGNFSLDKLSPAVYLIEVSFIGYAKNIQRIHVSAGATANAEIALTGAVLAGDEVVISAGRRAEKIRESLANIQVIDLPTIQTRQEPTLLGLLKDVPGIDYRSVGLGQQQVSARGYTSPFVSSNMLVYVDNRLTTMGSLGGTLGAALGVSKEDIDRVEVVLGPSSALYGANAANGIIHIITKDPKEHPGHSVTFSCGNRSLFRVGARSSALIGNMFGYKIAVEHYQANEFDFSIPITDNLKADGNLMFQAEPDLKIDNNVVNGSFFFYPHNAARISYSGGFSRANYLNQSNAGPIQFEDFDLWYHQIRLNFDRLWGLGSLFLQANVTENDLGDSYFFENAAVDEYLGMSNAEAIAAAGAIDKTKTYNIELQHNFTIGSKQFITWGAQYLDTQPKTEGTIIGDGPDGETFRIKESGVYAQYENQMLNNVRFTLTGRYDDNNYFGDQFSPKVSLAYLFQDHNFRVSYNKAFSSPPTQPAFSQIYLGKAGSLDLWLRGAYKGFTLVNASDGSIAKTIDRLEPITSDAYEIGYKGIVAGRLFVDLTVFTTKYENFISPPGLINDPANGVFIQDEDGNPMQEITISYINTGEIRNNGFDLNLELLLNSQLSVNGAISIILPGDFEDPTGTFTDDPALNSPERKYKGGIRYANWWKPGSFAMLSGRFVEGFDFYGSKHYNTGKVPNYTVVDLDLEVPFEIASFPDARVGVSVSNLLNNKHIELPGAPEIGLLVNGHVTFHF